MTKENSDPVEQSSLPESSTGRKRWPVREIRDKCSLAGEFR
jgi:hypothetical protein